MLIAADLLEKLGVQVLLTSIVDEAVAIRRMLGGRRMRLIVMGPVAVSEVYEAAEHNIEIFVHDPAWVQQAAALLLGKSGMPVLKVHLWVDSGFGRLGAFPEAVVNLGKEVQKHQQLQIVGTGTHIEGGGSLSAFDASVDKLKDAGIPTGTIHAANGDYSGTAPKDLVRVGGQIWRGAFEWVTTVQFLKHLPTGHCVSYSCTWQAKKPTTIAVLPVGYGEGYPYKLSGTTAQVRLALWNLCVNMCNSIDEGVNSIRKGMRSCYW